MGGSPPLGYCVAKEKKYAIDEATAPLVVKIFTMYDEGVPVADICKELEPVNI